MKVLLIELLVLVFFNIYIYIFINYYFKLHLDNRLFVILYKELYYRDMYTRMSRPSLENRFNSYMNYQELFSEILNQNNNKPINLQLPNLWLWDIIDEFVYQVNFFIFVKKKVNFICLSFKHFVFIKQILANANLKRMNI